MEDVRLPLVIELSARENCAKHHYDVGRRTFAMHKPTSTSVVFFCLFLIQCPAWPQSTGVQNPTSGNPGKVSQPTYLTRTMKGRSSAPLSYPRFMAGIRDHADQIARVEFIDRESKAVMMHKVGVRLRIVEVPKDKLAELKAALKENHVPFKTMPDGEI
jgi:hypothetical protein